MQKTALLDEFRRIKKQQTETLRREMISKINSVILELSKEIQFKEAYIFGSTLRRADPSECIQGVIFHTLN